MTRAELATVTERLERLERRARSMEVAAWTLVALVVLAAAIVSIVFWGPAPIASLCAVVVIAVLLGTWAGRRAERSAQKHLDRIGRSLPASAVGGGEARRQ